MTEIFLLPFLLFNSLIPTNSNNLDEFRSGENIVTYVCSAGSEVSEEFNEFQYKKRLPHSLSNRFDDSFVDNETKVCSEKKSK